MSSNPRVLIADVMSARAAEILREEPGIDVDVRSELPGNPAVGQIIQDYDAILIRSATTLAAPIFETAKRLKLIGRAGIGVDNVDLQAATANDVMVMNTPLGNATSTAEHAIAMMMTISRHIAAATASMREGRWDKKLYKGREVTGKTLGVIGAGNIGAIVIDRAQGLRMNVIAFDPYLKEERAKELGVECVSLKEMLTRSDFVTIHVPLVEGTRHLLNATTFRHMKPSAYLIHCARGGIVDEAALVEALDLGLLSGAALDVFETEPLGKDHPLAAHPRMVLTPHIAASTHEAQVNVAVQIAEQTVAFFTRGERINAVN
jgi:D-3-phosphoglycerate dehydrogenase